MYRMLIADDEQIVIDSIKFIVEKNFSDVVVAGTARSGREAIEKAESIRPDLVFMDIKMPGINGIDAIREIRTRLTNAVFVILTAYEQFDFAKEAVNLGVMEYLLKPVNRDRIVETVRKSVEILNSDREKRKKELELKEKLENVLPVLENGFIYSMLFFDDSSEELSNYKNIFEISEDGGYIMTVEFGETEESGQMGNRIGLSIKSHSFYPYFRDIMKSRCRCFVGPVMLNRIVVFIPTDMTGDEYSRRLEAVNYAEHIYNKLSEKVEAEFYIGIGKSYSGFDNITRSYEESLRAIRYANGKGFVHIMDIPIERTTGSQYPLAKEKILLEKASSGEAAACIQAFNFIFDWLNNEYSGSVNKIRKKLLELMVIFHRLAFDYKIDDGELIKQQDYIEELQSIQDVPELKIWCRERIEFITKSINDIREKRVNSLILRSISFIKENYKSDITLEDVSREVNISPHYFSKLFKDETGENFIEYLTSLRIQKAKEFLERGYLSIKEICFEIGYGDPNYFSRIFKKVVGVTPTEYKDSVQNKM